MAKSSIDDLPKQQQAEPYDMVLIVGPGLKISKIKAAYEEHQKAGRHCIIIGDGKKSIKDEDLNLLTDRLAPHTRIDIYMHGEINKKAHRVQVIDKSYLIPIAPPLGKMAKLKNLLRYGSFAREGSVMSAIDITTAEMFDKIQSYTGNKPVDGMQVHLWSCFGGAAAKDIDHLPEKAVLITHAAKSTSLIAMNEDTLIAGIKRYPNSPYNEFAHNITESAERATMTFTGFKHKVKAPKHPVTSPEELTRYLDHSVEAYTKALDKASKRTSDKALIDIGEIPYVAEGGLVKYRLEACIIEVEKGNLSYVKAYIKKTSENPDSLQLSNTCSALYLAVDNNNVPMVKLLLPHAKQGAKDAALSDAVFDNNVPMVELLINHADVNQADKDGYTALHWAVMANDMPMAKLLLKNGAEVMKESKYGDTALDIAVREKKVPMAELLLADVKQEDKNTTLHRAVIKNNVLMAELLIKEGADVTQGHNQGHYHGITVLHDAAGIGLPMVTALIKHGAVVNQVDSYGNTALHVAAMKGHEDIVSTLLDKDADVTLKNVAGKTACDCARDAGHLNVAETLERENTVYFHYSESSPEPLASPRLSPSGNSKLAAIAKKIGDTGIKHEVSSPEIAKPSTFQAFVQAQRNIAPSSNERKL